MKIRPHDAHKAYSSIRYHSTTHFIDTEESFEKRCSPVLQSLLTPQRHHGHGLQDAQYVGEREFGARCDCVVYVDCEGINLSRTGKIATLQLCVPRKAHLQENPSENLGDDGKSKGLGFYAHLKAFVVDILQLGEKLLRNSNSLLRRVLQSPHVIKVIHDGRRDTEALFFQYDVHLQCVFDTQIASALHLNSVEKILRKPSLNLEDLDSLLVMKDQSCWRTLVKVYRLLLLLHFDTPSLATFSVAFVAKTIAKAMNDHVIYMPKEESGDWFTDLQMARLGTNDMKPSEEREKPRAMNRVGIRAAAQLFFETALSRYDVTVIDAIASICRHVYLSFETTTIKVTFIEHLLRCVQREFESNALQQKEQHGPFNQHLAEEMRAYRRLSGAHLIKGLLERGLLAPKTAFVILSHIIDSPFNRLTVHQWVESCTLLYSFLSSRDKNFADDTVLQKIESKLTTVLLSTEDARRYLATAQRHVPPITLSDLTLDDPSDVQQQQQQQATQTDPDFVNSKIFGSASLVKLLKFYCFIDYSEKYDLTKEVKSNNELWAIRPLPQEMINAASNDVQHLHSLYETLMVGLHLNQDHDITRTILHKSLLYAHSFRMAIQFVEQLEIDDHENESLKREETTVWNQKRNEHQSSEMRGASSNGRGMDNQHIGYRIKDASVANLCLGDVDDLVSDQCMRILHTKSIGLVVGKRSKWLTQLQAIFPDCEIFSSGSQLPPHDTITLIGTLSEVKDLYRRLPKTHIIEISDSTKVSRIIGKQGVVIKNIRSLSGVRWIRFDEKTRNQQVKELQITGDDESVSMAKKMVNSIIKKKQKKKQKENEKNM